MAIHFYFTAHAIISILDDFFPPSSFMLQCRERQQHRRARKKFLTLFYIIVQCFFSERDINTSDFPLPSSSLT
jgi:hypothetical protein